MSTMPVMPINPQANAMLSVLRSRFLTALAGRVGELHETIDLLRDPRAEAAAEEKLHRMFHSLAGIGGTYGFQEITFLAKAGETACLATDRRDAASRTALLRSIVMAIDAARAGAGWMAA